MNTGVTQGQIEYTEMESIDSSHSVDLSIVVTNRLSSVCVLTTLYNVSKQRGWLYRMLTD